MRNGIIAAIILVVILLLTGGAVVAFAYSKPGSFNALSLRLANKSGLSDKSMCVYVPNETISFGILEEDTLKEWNNTLSYAVNPQNLSVLESPDGAILKQRFVPSERGSERVISVIKVEGRTTYELKQRFYFEEGFDWGGASESGKFGFGLGGGSAPTGGTTDKDGFTARLAWLGLGDGTAEATLYLYSADRTQNLPYGDAITVPNFVIPFNEWVDIAVRLTVNSAIDLANGRLSVQINDEMLLERTNIQWQADGEKPVIDRVIFSSFHGGNTPKWTPDSTVYAQFSDVCLYD